jgi:hypothetical protein
VVVFIFEESSLVVEFLELLEVVIVVAAAVVVHVGTNGINRAFMLLLFLVVPFQWFSNILEYKEPWFSA